MRTILVLSGLALAGPVAAVEDAELTATVSALDEALFDAFNACDVEATGRYFADDLEFFHDVSGLTGREETLAASRANCERRLGLRRSLVQGSLRVYPVPGYGAIQEGKHEFCHPVDGKQDCGTFGFVHVWKAGPEGNWQLTRVISFGH